MFCTHSFVSSKRICPQEDEEMEHGIMEQERAFLYALSQDAVAYSISSDWGGRLTLHATAIGDGDNSDAPHSSSHVGRPLVQLSKARENVAPVNWDEPTNDCVPDRKVVSMNLYQRKH